MTKYHSAYHATIMAAVMAHSNMGFGKPGTGEYENPRSWFFNAHCVRSGMSIETAVQWVIGYRAENDEHIEMFTAEAKGWIEKTQNADTFRKNYPDMYAWYVNKVVSKRWEHAVTCIAGASNQRLLTRVLHEAVKDVQDECGDIKNDAAAQMILHQVAHIMGKPTIMDLQLYLRYETEIDQQITAIREFRGK